MIPWLAAEVMYEFGMPEILRDGSLFVLTIYHVRDISANEFCYLIQIKSIKI